MRAETPQADLSAGYCLWDATFFKIIACKSKVNKSHCESTRTAPSRSATLFSQFAPETITQLKALKISVVFFFTDCCRDVSISSVFFAILMPDNPPTSSLPHLQWMYYSVESGPLQRESFSQRLCENGGRFGELWEFDFFCCCKRLLFSVMRGCPDWWHRLYASSTAVFFAAGWEWQPPPAAFRGESIWPEKPLCSHPSFLWWRSG